MEPWSLVGERWCGSGDRAVSISMLLSMVGTAGEIGGATWGGGAVSRGTKGTQQEGELEREIRRDREVGTNIAEPRH